MLKNVAGAELERRDELGGEGRGCGVGLDLGPAGRVENGFRDPQTVVLLGSFYLCTSHNVRREADSRRSHEAAGGRHDQRAKIP